MPIPNILLAEDNSVNQKVVVRMLQKLGYSADVASNGEEAVRLAQQSAYDVILMDLMMPRMDGYEATEVIRYGENGHRAYIIALTANTMGAERTRCLEVGMDDFMSKPFMMETLDEKLRAYRRPYTMPASGNMSVDDVIDRSVLRSLALMMDDEDQAYIKELLSDYLVDAARLRTDIYQAVTDEDAIALRRATHTLKSNSALFGARFLSTLCADFEQSAIQSDFAAVQSRLSEFDNMLESFQTALTTVVETGSY